MTPKRPPEPPFEKPQPDGFKKFDRAVDFLNEWAWLIIGSILMALFWGTILKDLISFHSIQP